MDLDLLRHDLFRTLWYMHGQPPLYNFFIGMMIRLFPQTYPVVCHAIHLIIGIVFYLCSYHLMKTLCGSKRTSFALTVAFMMAPATIVLENFLFYTFPVAVVLCLCAVFWHRYLARGKFSDVCCFMVLTAVILLTRSYFHLLWFAIVAGFLALLTRKIKPILAAAIVPFLLCFGLYFKNWILFDHFAGTTWLGISIAQMTTEMLPLQQRQVLVKQGKLSQASLIKPYNPLEDYKHLVALPNTGIPVLDRMTGPASKTNYNNLAYIQISDWYLKDALYVMRHHPDAYLRAVKRSCGRYVTPASDRTFSMANREVLWAVQDALLPEFLAGKSFALLDPNDKEERREARFPLARKALKYGIPCIFLYAFYATMRIFLRKPVDLPRAGTLLFLLLVMTLNAVVINCLEPGENMRMRYPIDLFLVTFLAMFIQDFRRVCRRLTVARARRRLDAQTSTCATSVPLGPRVSSPAFFSLSPGRGCPHPHSFRFPWGGYASEAEREKRAPLPKPLG